VQADDDGSLSRVHAAVMLRRDDLYLVDLGSTNGSSILDARGNARAELDANQRAWRLDDGERIGLSTKMVVIIVNHDA
jgi:pSer/pThr/pTyr-binding forkhead associated (FHA) protein